VVSIPSLKSHNHGAPVAPACFKAVELLVVSSCSNRGVVCLVVQTLIVAASLAVVTSVFNRFFDLFNRFFSTKYWGGPL